MTIIADITLPSATFPLGRVLQSFPDATMDLERVVPLRESLMPFIWIEDDDTEALESSLRAHSRIEDVEVLMTADAETLFRIDWSPSSDGLTEALIETEATVLEARGTADNWDFRLRFSAHEDLSAFNVALTESGIPVTLRRIYHPPLEGASSPMSPVQRETLLAAYRNGYYQVPRRISQTELAERLEISDSALSQRIRRAVSTLIEREVLAEDDPLR
ncbi:helix-turn-helix domain-containing protein [Halalkalicoccus jeotgali]|uniref:Bacterio-opsin activator HTH domain protein n=1 Tax=Halalkalicoccus jeotgali (strain DSM 18796 / CECT 7217 / JCM 14584 / KCTC 4019 / B3) TaxID=795797 RepID=D8J7X3_HALJB|nr:helix-turn-helix domain-containing protein [Halalkalicoccus jeotgali]ADJ14086.1 Bacterio-opsin activator HTH domain protein [Halalkalicoccus jeotgali B3]ELY33870.1 bacterio-opsin activator HTH domain-containing protein [Halalkalicoccus jeotgali B3]